jgi:N-acetylglucosamine-6-phosphate deacetylase
MPEYKLITNIDIYTPKKHIPNGAILIKDDKIAYAGPILGTPHFNRILGDVSPKYMTCDFKYHLAVPGFMDIHLHGGGGADFMDASPEAGTTVLKTHLKKGTTSSLPTLMTASDEKILRGIEAVLEIKKNGKMIPDILGLHLEGPYITKEKRGAQPEKDVRPFSSKELRRYLKASGGRIRIMTLAPEIPRAGSLIRYLKAKKIIVAAGHSNATFGQAVKGIRAGISHGTHLFNAMSGIFHRDPGLAGALLMDDSVTVELIADGIHLHPSIPVFVAKIKPLEKIILVTDATRHAGRKKSPLRTEDGRLSGSAITLDIALKNMITWTGRPLTEILPMLTLNPARLLGIAGCKGRLAKGADADIVILDKKFNVKHVFLRGEKAI